MLARCFPRHAAVVAFTGFIASASPALADFPRDGCASVSFFDTTNWTTDGVYSMVGGFSVGNRLVLTVSGQNGKFELTNNASQVVLSVTLSSTSQTVAHIVSAA